jgi:hypothetical protein
MLVYSHANPSSSDLIILRNWKQGKLHGHQFISIGTDKIPLTNRLDQRKEWHHAIGNNPRQHPIGASKTVTVVLVYNEGQFRYMASSCQPNELPYITLVQIRSLIEFYGEEFHLSLITQYSSQKLPIPYVESKNAVNPSSMEIFLDSIRLSGNTGPYEINTLFKMYVNLVLQSGSLIFLSKDQFRFHVKTSTDFCSEEECVWVTPQRSIKIYKHDLLLDLCGPIMTSAVKRFDKKCPVYLSSLFT